MGYWRNLYNLLGWEYPETPKEKTLQNRNELMIQIKKSRLKLKPTPKNPYRLQTKPIKFKGKVKGKHKRIVKKNKKLKVKPVG